MKDLYARRLRQAGAVLILVGIIDVLWMLYCVIVRHVSYSSSINLFAIVAGIFIYRGSARAARGFVCLVSIGVPFLASMWFVRYFICSGSVADTMAGQSFLDVAVTTALLSGVCCACALAYLGLRVRSSLSHEPSVSSSPFRASTMRLIFGGALLGFVLMWWIEPVNFCVAK